jgi:glycosyltransferase involved in cell wall biosynthesis
MSLFRRVRNLRHLYAQLWGLREDLAALRDSQAQLLRALEALQDRELENREKLRSLRGSAAYESAFYEKEPLVSVTIPTWTNTRGLVDEAIPSVLAQTYQNIEVVVVGDASPPETERALTSLADRRIRFMNLPHRGPYPDEPRRRWYVAGVPAINEAARLARGTWIAPQNDDDVFTRDHIERLLEAARSTRSEVAYGRFEIVPPGELGYVAGTYPPVLGQFTWQAAIYHAGLRFFEMELADAWFDRPGDWSLCRRMLVAGVRMTMIDDIVARLYPSATARTEVGER